jgi:DNA-directed RNA polymerase specialized sigma subunit
LDEQQADVIKVHYFEGRTIPQTALNLEISITTTKRRHKSAVEKLTDMYNLISD